MAFLSHVSSLLVDSFSSGAFDTSIHTHHTSTAPPSSSLLTLASINFQSLDITHLFYDNVLVSSVGIKGMAYDSASSSTASSNTLMIGGAVLFMAVFAAAVVVFQRARRIAEKTDEPDLPTDALRI